MSLAADFRTLRYLTRDQVLGRIVARLKRPWHASLLYDRLCLATNDASAVRRFAPSLWPGEPENGRRILDGRIRLLNRERRLETSADWRAAAEPLLWRFTLHYFDWLGDLESLGEDAAHVRARNLVDDWIRTHRRPSGLAWHPYPLSLRLFAWLRHGKFLIAGSEPEFETRFAASLDRQARHLSRVVERHVGGNHLIKNLKALIAVGLCVPNREALTGPALAELEVEVARQILPDGGHYERSPSYHLQVLIDLIEIRALLAESGPTPPWLESATRRMAAALATFRLGDGRLALFNDGDIGRLETITAVERHLGGLPTPPGALSDTGTYRLQARDTIAIMDAGPCGPDELPAHAHADMLSFEFSDGPARLVVNGGTYAYQDGRWRNRLRGTAAHSTVEVDGQDSAEVHGVFRLGRRPSRVSATRVETDVAITVEGVHDGYRHLGVIHRRKIALSRDGRILEGEDRIDDERPASKRHRIAIRFHLHPDVQTEMGADGRWWLTLPNGARWSFQAFGHDFRLESSPYAPHFYDRRWGRQIVIDAEAERGLWRWRFLKD